MLSLGLCAGQEKQLWARQEREAGLGKAGAGLGISSPRVPAAAVPLQNRGRVCSRAELQQEQGWGCAAAPRAALTLCPHPGGSSIQCYFLRSREWLPNFGKTPLVFRESRWVQRLFQALLHVCPSLGSV